MNSRPCPLRPHMVLYAVFIVALFLGAAWLLKISRDRVRPAPLGQPRADERAKLLTEQSVADEKALTTTDWVDKNKGFVRIPIEQAMSLTVTEWKNPKAARALLIERAEKLAVPPPAPPKVAAPPSKFD